MINISHVANYIEGLLNRYGANYGKNFKVFADEGDLKRAIKTECETPINFTSSILEVVSSQLTPIRDVRLETYSFQLTMFVDLQLSGKDEEGQSINLKEIKEVLQALVDENTGTSSMINIDGKEYTQTLVLSYPTNGQKTDLGFINDCLPLYWQINLAFFENGVNANNCKLNINGLDIPFTRCVFTRVKTADNQTFANDESQKVTILSQGLSVDFVMPALNNDNNLSALVMEDILNGSNYALSVKIITPLAEKCFIGTFGNTSGSLDIATNVGLNISVVEGQEELLDYDYTNKWDIQETDENNVILNIDSKAVVYWGDGDYSYTDEATELTHSYKDETVSHTIRIFRG